MKLASDFDWAANLKHRTERLSRFIGQGDLASVVPKPILDWELRLVRKSIHKTHSMWPVIWNDIQRELVGLRLRVWYAFREWYCKHVLKLEGDELWDVVFSDTWRRAK